MLLSLSSMLLVAGCKQNDPVSQAEKAYKINGAAIPGIEETKQIAKDGFIYGLPLVMNYVSTYELFIDPTSSQYKAADMPNVVKIQADYKVQPLSAYLRQPPPPAPAAINYPKANAELAKPISSNFSILRFSMPRLVRRKQASAPGSPALASAPASSST